jgi:hypothetical protein
MAERAHRVRSLGKRICASKVPKLGPRLLLARLSPGDEILEEKTMKEQPKPMSG